jgi:D-arabinose 1-dehydrogenase-like Zn-dependent alcohol dehydrogenase
VIEREKPVGAASVHAHSVPGWRGDGPGIFVDPRDSLDPCTDTPNTPQGRFDDDLASAMLQAIQAELSNPLKSDAGRGRRWVGAITVQLAKAHGAYVTGVDHPRKLDLVRGLGVDEVVDYTSADVTRSGQRYDLIVDIPGNRPFAAYRDLLTPDGKYVLIGHDQFGRAGRRWLGSVPRFAQLAVLSLFVRHVRRAGPARLSKEAMATLRAHLELGQLTPVIDRTYNLSEAGEAIRYLAGRQPLGRVVLTM